MKVVSIVAAGILVGVLVGCATTETQPSAAVTSLTPNAQQWFRVNWKAEPGLEKVVVYATLNPDATINEVTHAAHQEGDGTFTSKPSSPVNTGCSNV